MSHFCFETFNVISRNFSRSHYSHASNEAAGHLPFSLLSSSVKDLLHYLKYPRLLATMNRYTSSARAQAAPAPPANPTHAYFEELDFPYCEEYTNYHNLVKIGQGTFG